MLKLFTLACRGVLFGVAAVFVCVVTAGERAFAQG
jgi:hypothetical protein